MKGLVVQDGRLTLTDVSLRPGGAGEVEVEVVSASVNPTDLELAAGVYDDHLARLGKLALPRTGLEFSGTVRTPGKRFAEGDPVFGYVDLLEGDKSHQQRLWIHEDLIARKPPSMTFAQAAAVPLGAQTSIVALRDTANAKPGEHVLIHGAAGGLGVYAVQIARRMGLEVTAVAGPAQQDFLRELGANHVHDYTTTNIHDSQVRFDVIFDLTTKMQFDEIEHLLTTTGRFMPSEPLKSGVDFSEGSRSGRRSVNLWVPHGDGAILADVADWVSAGTLQVFVDRIIPFSSFERAFERQRQPGRRGRIVLDLAEETPHESAENS